MRNDDRFPSHPMNLAPSFAPVLADPSTLGLQNTTNIPRDASDTSVMAADAMAPLTDAGTVMGDATIPADVQLFVEGPAVFDGTINSHGLAQFAETGADFNETGKKRITFDSSGSLVLRLLTTLAEGVKAILGDFSVTIGSLTSKSDPTSTASLPITVNAGTNAWVQSAAFYENTLLSTDLPSYDGNFTVAGTVQAKTTSNNDHSIDGDAYGGTDARVRVKISIDGGSTWIDKGTVGSVSDLSAPVHTTSSSFSGTFAFGTGTSIIVRLYVESYCSNTGAGGSTSSGQGLLSAVSAIAWKQSSGTTYLRRGLFLGKESGQPQITFENLLAGEEPTATTVVEGETWYSGVDHTHKYFDGTGIRSITPPTAYLSADQGAITSTAGVAVSAPLQLLVAIGEVWEIEWSVDVVFSTTTATLVAKVSGGSIAGVCTVLATNGTPNVAPTVHLVSFDNVNTNSIGPTHLMGNTGSTTLRMNVLVRARIEGTGTSTVSLLVGSSAGTVTPKKYSSMKATRIK